jgi:hypothetical protein
MTTMTKTSDPQMFSSGYERNRLDRYWTHPWMTEELIKKMELLGVLRSDMAPVWEPGAGQGDMSRALMALGMSTYSTDIDMGEFDYDIGPGHERSFLDEIELPEFEGKQVKSIITNPPYNSPWRGIGNDFIRHGLSFFEPEGITFMAMLMRSEYRCGKSRKDMFGECDHYMGELVLTTRPRWDYGDPDAPEKAAPRHNFSWFLWDYNHAHEQDPIQIFSYMPKGFKP